MVKYVPPSIVINSQWPCGDGNSTSTISAIFIYWYIFWNLFNFKWVFIWALVDQQSSKPKSPNGIVVFNNYEIVCRFTINVCIYLKTSFVWQHSSSIKFIEIIIFQHFFLLVSIIALFWRTARPEVGTLMFWCHFYSAYPLKDIFLGSACVKV